MLALKIKVFGKTISDFVLLLAQFLQASLKSVYLRQVCMN